MNRLYSIILLLVLYVRMFIRNKLILLMDIMEGYTGIIR